MTANRSGVAFWGNENVPKLDSNDGYITVNVLKTTELYVVKEGTLWYMNYSPIKII